ncbi:MAG TPA: nuclear transport factor 2 family protein [Conexibacter sp.]|jgi:3-phenylpropionate/cinnamic acid dioxygenase small subunit
MSLDVASIEAQVAQLHARLRELEDREQINALFMEYRRMLDEKEFDGYAGLFAENGRFTTSDPAWNADGRDGIHAMVTGMVGSMLTVRAGDDFHIVGNVAIGPIEGDRASARSTWTYVVRGDDDNPLLVKIGHYEDELVREDGVWRFLHRHAPTDVPAT